MERAEQSGGLHKRSAEGWGNSLRARGAELPLGALVLGFSGNGAALRSETGWSSKGMESRYRRVSRISLRGGAGMEGPYERVLLTGLVRVRSTVLKRSL